jgi:hypothetical protein
MKVKAWGYMGFNLFGIPYLLTVFTFFTWHIFLGCVWYIYLIWMSGVVSCVCFRFWHLFLTISAKAKEGTRWLSEQSVCVCKFLLQETESERTLVILVMSNHCQKLTYCCWRQLILGMVQENGCSEVEQGLLVRPRSQCSPSFFGRLPCKYVTPDLGLLEPTEKPRQGLMSQMH